MLDNSKEEILSRLYVLRAGLSVISVEKEKIDGLNQDIKNDKAQTEYRIQKAYKQMKYAKRMVISEKEKSERIDTTFSERQKMKTKNTFSLLGKLMLIVLPIFCAIWPFKFSNYYDSNNLNYDGLEMFGMAILILFSFGIVIAAPIGLIFWIKEYGIFPHTKREFKKLEKQSELIQKEKREAPSKIIALNKEIKILDQSIPEAYKSHDLIVTEKSAMIETGIRGSNIFYRVLEEAYRGFLDVRDWQHVDLLIFYFESGRADDLKEALLLVDRQLQNDAIVNAINDASSRICGTINAGLQQLQSSIVKCFSLLSEQMYSMQMQMEIQHNEQMGIQRAQLAGVLELAKQTNMSNALMQKANMNSMKLMEDVGYMKMLAEHENIRKSNNI